ncbi:MULTISPECIES: phosphopyruvate hydratase [Micromonospora]|uniref:Enolase n=1 Tax=Micromonospora solifontis TaxID=2487138 RepID=A0ABX9WCX4_9ACTN|nr:MULTISPECIES: phosphopyruvate hydratase [Micromonospora]NES16989.1 phosphopyruvate hydratase [Micromonospora sp. PPF5-17B]NES38402.1 phosphopyruvate hydratase [Micromonospora solifontis]NES58730.1 phosphopyruvate hydratase [Micromonospora sp. PPF5-6]RNL95817.1 phosphopyruvate hydratase [Micromonospora solifontis]
MARIASVQAVEILDSRGRPTLSVTLTTADGQTAWAGVPSGASTGSGEAVELRDGDKDRYGGKGVLTAVGHVNGEIRDALTGREFPDLATLDEALVNLDGTENKSRLGANAIVGVSMAAARAFAGAAAKPLWRYLTPDGVAPRLPVPHFNVVNGGAHAPNRLDFQEFMIAPVGAPTLAEAVRAGAEVYAALRARLADAGFATGLGDEGGFAPDIEQPEQVLDTLVAAIGDAGYTAGSDGVAIALDPAASEFHRDGRYHVAGEALTADEMIDRYAAIVDRYPVWSIEDGLAEDDWDGWTRLTERLAERVQLVGDDLLVTNPVIVSRAIERRAGTAALIKVNQIGTVTETLDTMRICRQAGWAQMVSHRSGETADAFIADLATGAGCGQLKTGAPARGERVAKYNRLIEIEAADRLPYGR